MDHFPKKELYPPLLSSLAGVVFMIPNLFAGRKFTAKTRPYKAASAFIGACKGTIPRITPLDPSADNTSVKEYLCSHKRLSKPKYTGEKLTLYYTISHVSALSLSCYSDFCGVLGVRATFRSCGVIGCIVAA